MRDFLKLLSFLALLTPFMLNAQSAIKKKDLKVAKIVKKQAKQYEKQGYMVSPGLPMEKKLEKAMEYELATDEKTGYPKFLFGEAIVVAETQVAAKMQALNSAKINLAGKIQSKVAGLIEDNTANQQLNTEEAASVTKAVQAAQTLIMQELGQVIEAYTLYRKTGKNMEATTKIFYSQEMALEKAKKVLRKKLEAESEELQGKLDKMLEDNDFFKQ